MKQFNKKELEILKNTALQMGAELVHIADTKKGDILINLGDTEFLNRYLVDNNFNYLEKYCDFSFISNDLDKAS